MDFPNEDRICRAVACLKSGGVVAFPTDTLYGLGADAFNETAIERIFKIKGRSGSMALPVLLGDIKDITLVARDVPDIAWALAERFLPGALSLVLKKIPSIPLLLTGGADTIAIRVPDHPIPRGLARELKGPITGTSANRSGFPPAKTSADVRAQLGSGVDIVIDGGPSFGGVPSTVVDVSTGIPHILRQGAISHGEIEAAWGKPVEIAQ